MFVLVGVFFFFLGGGLHFFSKVKKSEIRFKKYRKKYHAWFKQMLLIAQSTQYVGNVPL